MRMLSTARAMLAAAVAGIVGPVLTIRYDPGHDPALPREPSPRRQRPAPYTPPPRRHGQRECARRVRQIAYCQIRPENGLHLGSVYARRVA